MQSIKLFLGFDPSVLTFQVILPTQSDAAIVYRKVEPRLTKGDHELPAEMSNEVELV
jgi:hypothetical protein